MGFNPQSILNQFDTVNTGIVSLKDFYMQVCYSSNYGFIRLTPLFVQIQTDLEDFINQLARGEVRRQKMLAYYNFR